MPPVNSAVEIFERPDELAPVLDDWEALADSAGRPFARPSWVLAWWSHLARSGSLLRVACVWDEGQLSTVVPLVAKRTALGVTYRFLGHHLSPHTDVLSRSEPTGAQARLIAEALLEHRPTPRVVLWDGAAEDSAWPQRFQSVWPGGARLHRDYSLPVPVLEMKGRTFDEWMSGQSGNFRQKMRQQLRRQAEAGVEFSLRDTSSCWKRDIDEFARLHHANWESRGGSGVVVPGVTEMLTASAEALDGSGRFLLATMVHGERTVSSAIFVAANGVLTYWLGGYDDTYSALQPGVMTVFSTIEHAFQDQYRIVDLGPGGQRYKYRFSDGEHKRTWYTMVPRRGVGALQRVHHAPARLRMTIASSLDPSIKRRLRRIRQRIPFG